MSLRVKKTVLFAAAAAFLFIIGWGVGFYFYTGIEKLRETIDTYILGLLIGCVCFFVSFASYVFLEQNEIDATAEEMERKLVLINKSTLKRKIA